jgi:hypothetical protein
MTLSYFDEVHLSYYRDLPANFALTARKIVEFRQR